MTGHGIWGHIPSICGHMTVYVRVAGFQMRVGPDSESEPAAARPRRVSRWQAQAGPSHCQSSGFLPGTTSYVYVRCRTYTLRHRTSEVQCRVQHRTSGILTTWTRICKSVHRALYMVQTCMYMYMNLCTSIERYVHSMYKYINKNIFTYMYMIFALSMYNIHPCT